MDTSKNPNQRTKRWNPFRAWGSSIRGWQTSVAFLSLLLLLVALRASSAGAAQEESLRFPAEFEQQEAIWMAWPAFSYTQADRSEPVIMEMLKALQPHIHVKMLIPPETRVDQILRKNHVPTTNLSYHTIPYSDIWLRDMGPLFVVVNGNQKKVLDFNFNGWGMPDTFFPEDLATDEQVDRAVAEEQGLGVVSADIKNVKLISEGGNRELNGKGTMIAIAKTELQRNPQLTKAQLEAAYKKYLGVKKVIWLEQGVVEDSPPTVGRVPGPNGDFAYPIGVEHVDEVARFASPRTILLAEVTETEAKANPIAAENRNRLERSYNILSNSTDQDGKPFLIIRVPAAEIQYYPMSPGDWMYDWLAIMQFDDGLPFPSNSVNMLVANGYMNFVISNGVVLAANYGNTTRDKKVAQILKMVFPNREIVGINPFAINLGGGGMHCITQQEPLVEPR